MTVALITGASAGLGRALGRALAHRGWTLIIDARGEEALHREARSLSEITRVVAVAGDVADPAHREALAAAGRKLGGIRLLINNASRLGPSPQPGLAHYPLDELERVYAVDVFAPLALMQLTIPMLAVNEGTIVNISSDAAVERYAGWGGYGSAKAALDQLSAVLGEEHQELRVYAFDPGDMRTDMHQRAFPEEDISDRPEPETVVPAFLELLDCRPPSGRYRASELRSAAEIPA